MKKNLTTLLSVLFIAVSAFSQKTKEGDTLYFASDERDEKFAVIVESMDSEAMKKITFRAGGELSYRPNFLSVAYYIPKKHYFELDIGPGIGAMGTYLFHTKRKYKETSQSVGASGNTIFAAKLPYYKEKSFGLRYGLGFFHWSTLSFLGRKMNSIVTTRLPLTIGISRFNLKHAKYRVFENGKEKKVRSGQQMFSLNLDAVFFPVHFHKVNPEYTVVELNEGETLESNEISQEDYDEHLESTELPFALHLSMQGSLGFWGSGHWGMRYHLGGLYYPAGDNTRLEPTGGIGLIYFFDNISL